MKQFVAGFCAGMAVLVAGVFLYLYAGFLDPSAARTPSAFESAEAMKFLDASVEWRASRRNSPIPPTSHNLQTGLRLYEADCASCHGDRASPHGALGLALYPRAPQFLEDAPDMPEYENFYLIRNGIRWTGMPGWSAVLSPDQTWILATFLSHINRLPPAVSAQWKPGSPASAPAPPARPAGESGHE